MSMQFFPMCKVVNASSIDQPQVVSATKPNIYVSVLVDCAYIIEQQGQTIDTGIYMIDNMISRGSGNECKMNLDTYGSYSSLIGWQVVPIDPTLINLSVEITFIQICSGPVFGSPPIKASGIGYSWLGQLMYTGQQTYAIQIKVTEGLTPVSYYVNWQAAVNCF